MKLFQSGVAAFCIGILLLIFSFLWPYIVPQSVMWDESNAATYQEASAEFHELSFDASVSPEKLEESKRSYEEQREKLDRVVAAKTSVPYYLRVTGFIVTCVGVCVLWVAREQS